jgi:IS30 family transposase
MGTRYQQLSLDDRCTIARLHAQGGSLRQIAAALDRNPSTISREITRNITRQTGYRPAYAQDQSKARRWKGSKLDRSSELRDLSWPVAIQQIAGRLALRLAHPSSAMSLCRSCPDRPHNFSWRYCPRQPSVATGHKAAAAGFIKDRAIAQRPRRLKTQQPGHWEADFILFSKYDRPSSPATEVHAWLPRGHQTGRSATVKPCTLFSNHCLTASKL